MSQTNKLGLLLFLVSFLHVEDGGWLGGVAVVIANIGALLFLIPAHLTKRPPDAAKSWRCRCGWANDDSVKLCSACGTQRR